jgi:hypothetical protein
MPIARALLYHARRLAESYCDLTEKAAREAVGTQLVPDRFLFGDQLEPWFELDSAVTAARRVYDALGYPL